MTAVWPPRSVLFVPAARPDRYPKALATRADVVCVDLEDAVAPGEKALARDAVAGLLRGGAWSTERSWVRVNHPETAEGAADLEALLPAMGRLRAPSTIVIPKVASPPAMAGVRAAAGAAGAPVRIVAMIETAEGLEAAARLARVRGLAALFFGGVDLSAELGCALDSTALLYARSRVVHAAALGRVPAIDVPFLDLRDVDGLLAESESARRLGFGGKAAIHPDQVASIHAAFAPSDDEIAHARRVLEASTGEGGGVVVVDGRMVDAPVIEAARRTLARAAAPTG